MPERPGFLDGGLHCRGSFYGFESDFEMDFYSDLVGHRPVVVPRNELLARGIFKVIWMGEPTAFRGWRLRT